MKGKAIGGSTVVERERERGSERERERCSRVQEFISSMSGGVGSRGRWLGVQ